MTWFWRNQGWAILELVCVLSLVIAGRRDRDRTVNSGIQGDFRVVWNVPTQECKNLGVNVNVKKYGIEENARNGWTGSVISIFYADEMGLYPEVRSDGTVVHGGIPQKVDLNAHRTKCEADINRSIPDRNFSGLGVIDYEGWRPIWQRNWDSKSVYKNLSEALVREQHPDWSSAQVTQEAMTQFEQAARAFLTATLETAQRLRPHGQWGFYLFPECYNYQGQRKCDRTTRLNNNRLLWMFNMSTALFPSAYLDSPHNPRQNADFVYGELHEASRLRKKLVDHCKPIYLYSRVRYPTNLNWYSQADLNNTIKQAFDLRMNGVVLWDDNTLHANRAICRSTKQYVDSVLGPFVRQLLANSTPPRHSIIWSNRHTISKPFNKKMGRRTEPCRRLQRSRNGQLEIVHMDLV